MDEGNSLIEHKAETRNWFAPIKANSVT